MMQVEAKTNYVSMTVDLEVESGEESMPDKHKSRHTSASEVWHATRMCRRANV